MNVAHWIKAQTQQLETAAAAAAAAAAAFT